MDDKDKENFGKAMFGSFLITIFAIMIGLVILTILRITWEAYQDDPLHTIAVFVVWGVTVLVWTLASGIYVLVERRKRARIVKINTS